MNSQQITTFLFLIIIQSLLLLYCHNLLVEQADMIMSIIGDGKYTSTVNASNKTHGHGVYTFASGAQYHGELTA